MSVPHKDLSVSASQNSSFQFKSVTSTRHFDTSQSLQHKSVTSTQVRHSNTNSSLEHKSVTSSHHFNTSLQRTSVTSTHFRHFNTNPSTQHKSVTSTHHLHMSRILQVPNLCWLYVFVWKWRTCVEVTVLCLYEKFVLKWRVEVTGMWKWGVLSLFKLFSREHFKFQLPNTSIYIFFNWTRL